MTGLNAETILDCVHAATQLFEERAKQGRMQPAPTDYSINNTSERVVSLILGTAQLSNAWDGIRRNKYERRS